MSSRASKPSLYPDVPRSNPDSSSPFVSNPNNPPDPTYGYDPSSHRGGPGLDAAAAAGDDLRSPSAPPDSSEEVLLVLHPIDKEYSVELGCGDFSLIALPQGENAVAVLARVADEAQWPLTKDGAAVKVDDSHYFSLRALEKAKSGSDSSDDEGKKGGGASDDPLNYGDYSGTTAKLIAAGSGQLIKRILWCGDVTVDRLNWVNEVMKKRMTPAEKAQINKKTLKRLERAKKMTRMTEKAATGVLSGVDRVSGFVTSSVANSSVGKKFFGGQLGQMVLASHDGYKKVCDAVEVAGRNVLATSATVTTELVSHRYGEEAGKATHEVLNAAGHAIGTVRVVSKIVNFPEQFDFDGWDG